MAAYRVLQTSFPTVLSQYLPEQATVGDGASSKHEEEEEEEVKESEEKTPRPTKTVRVVGDTNVSHRDKTHKRGAPVAATSSSHKRTHPLQPPLRQRTAMSLASMGSGRKSGLRKQEAETERLEHVADVWQQARSEVLSERHVKLQEKVVLQHQLMRAQELQTLQQREQREQQQVQKRQEEKQKKQTKEAALQDVCKQSLDADKKKARSVDGGSKLGASVSTPTIPSAPSSAHSSCDGSDHNGSDSSDVSPAGGGLHRPHQRASPRHSGYRPSMALPEHLLSSSSMRELEDEEEEEETKEEGALSGLPSHHAQLYKLYGKQADYFLHPKPAEPAQVTKAPVNPKIKNQKVTAMHIDSGHIGAGELWDTLRKDSKGKLVRHDHRFPQELKSAFSAFVRERLTKHSRPVERSFCATEDVPDIKRLMDQSKLRRTRLYRHKTELMYRSSVNNMDRTSILLHNSPLPDITETGQLDSISRYLPSWMDDESEVSEEEYMRWVKQRQIERIDENDDEDDNENARHSAHGRQLSETTNELQSIWQAIASRNKKPRQPRYQFLTEKEAQSKGMFTHRFQEEKQQREKPQPHHVSKSYSALEFSHPSSSLSVPSSRERDRSAHSAMQLHRYKSDWQPLSMNALVEYKTQLETEGEGEFEHGRMKMWPAVASSVA